MRGMTMCEMRIGVGLMLLIAAGCSESPGEVRDTAPAEAIAPEFEVRDSAGVRIVTYTSLGEPDSTSWSVDLERALRIGRFGDAPQDSLYILGRPQGAARLADDRIAILDGQAGNLRVFDPDGSFSRTVGRSGDGPGEFRRVIGLYRGMADSLMVSEYGGRVHHLDPFGRHVRTRQLDVGAWGGIQAPEVRGVFEDGSLLVITRNERDRITTLHAVSVEDESAVPLTTFRTPRYYGIYASPEDFRPLQLVTAEIGPIYTVRGDDLYLTSRGLWEVRRIDSAGRLDQVIRFDRSTLESDRDPPFEWRHPASEGRASRELEDTLRVVRDSLGVSPFSGFLVDLDGHYWLREQRDRDDDFDRPARWYVFTAEGVLERVVRLPHWWYGYSEIGLDYIVTLESDALGVSTAMLAPLIRR